MVLVFVLVFVFELVLWPCRFDKKEAAVVVVGGVSVGITAAAARCLLNASVAPCRAAASAGLPAAAAAALPGDGEGVTPRLGLV